MTTMSPLQLEMLLHYRYSREPYRNSPAGRDAHEWAVENGLLTFASVDGVKLIPVYELTPRGEALIDKVLSTPLPRQVTTWVFDEEARHD